MVKVAPSFNLRLNADRVNWSTDRTRFFACSCLGQKSSAADPGGTFVKVPQRLLARLRRPSVHAADHRAGLSDMRLQCGRASLPVRRKVRRAGHLFKEALCKSEGMSPGMG